MEVEICVTKLAGKDYVHMNIDASNRWLICRTKGETREQIIHVTATSKWNTS